MVNINEINYLSKCFSLAKKFKNPTRYEVMSCVLSVGGSMHVAAIQRTKVLGRSRLYVKSIYVNDKIRTLNFWRALSFIESKCFK